MGAAQHQRVHLAWASAKAAHGRGVLRQQFGDVFLGWGGLQGQGALFDGQGQPIASLHREPRLSLHRVEQTRELVTGHGAARGDHANVACLAQGHRGFEGGFYPDQRQLWVLRAQFVDRRSGGGVAGHDQRLDLVMRQQIPGDGMRALTHVEIGFLAIGRVGVVGQVDKVFMGQGALQRLQHAQAPNATVKNANGGVHVQPALTPMPLNSPVAMRFCHSAGPVMWALVPPASTATVTGMSTTSNS